MNLTRWALIAMFTIAPHMEAQANRPCLSKLPDYLQATLEQDNWKILQPEDLADDLRIFKGNHPGQCPGVASGNFFPKAQESHIVAMIQRDAQNRVTEKLLLVAIGKKKTETLVILPPAQLKTPAVVWKLDKGRWRGIDGTIASISHDSFVNEQILSVATQYYYDGKHLKSFPLSH
jgi:hypothetical protein